MPTPPKSPPPEAVKTPTAPTKEPPDFKMQEQAHPSEFFLPADKLKLAGEKFDECGAIEIVIRRTLTASKVEIRALSAPIVPAEPEEAAEAPVAPEPPKPTEKPVAVNVAPAAPVLQLPPKAKIFMGLPTLTRGVASRMTVLLGNYRGALGPFNPEFGHDIDVIRNRIANNFLKSECEWLFTMDDDIVCPLGSASHFSRITGAKWNEPFMSRRAAETLTNTNRSLVGGIYVSRGVERKIVCQQGFSPKTKQDERFIDDIRRMGPRDEVVLTEWVGLGCAAIHRAVFGAIQKAHPELYNEKTKDWEFFKFTPEVSEDIHFCRLAASCGHDPYLHLGVICGHITEIAQLP